MAGGGRRLPFSALATTSLVSAALLLTVLVPAGAGRCPRNASKDASHDMLDEMMAEEAPASPARRPDCPVEEEVEFESDVHIARLEFHRVETIFTVLVFIMVVILAKMGMHCSWRLSKLW